MATNFSAILIIWITQPQQANASCNNYAQLPASNTYQFIIFQEIGEMAADLSYIHVTLPLKISTLYQQSDVFKVRNLE